MKGVMEQKLRSEAKALLEQEKVAYVAGFAPGTMKFTTTPLITRDKDSVDKLVINPFIVNNLAGFLTGLKGKVAVVAKGCDGRSIVSLLQDNKVAREDVFIIGVPCPGMIDLTKVEKLAGRDRDKLDDITRDGDKVTVTVVGKSSQYPVNQVLFDNCLACDTPNPPVYDILLDEPAVPVGEKETSQAVVEELRQKAPAERWQFWKKEFERCVRCYACRSVCPACFCERCFVEETEPKWVLPAPRWQDNLLFQVTRNIHVAGRCTDCGECQRVCPVNIPLRSLSREMYDIVGELFSFKSGMDPEAQPLMVHYEQEEVEDFFR